MSSAKEPIPDEIESEEEDVMEEEDKEVVEEETEDTSLANSDVVTKYQEAAKIANIVLKELIAMVSASQLYFLRLILTFSMYARSLQVFLSWMFAKLAIV
jgi:hypothetical protein